MAVGTLKECQKRRSREELEETVIEEVDDLKKKFKPAAEINSQVLARPGFLAAYNALTADMLGVYRPNLKIVTMVGPPEQAKLRNQHTLPKAGRAIIGNGGTWFANPTSTVMVFEEFAGQIPLQKMLKLLDPYPMALEVKGGMRPAMYTLAIITSNTRPDGWYRNEEQDGKRSDALLHSGTGSASATGRTGATGHAAPTWSLCAAWHWVRQALDRQHSHLVHE